MDITVKCNIAKPPAAVARTLFDPSNDSWWINGVLKAESLTQRVDPTVLGFRVRRQGIVLGQMISCVTEVIASEANRKLVMRFVEGPLKGEVSYVIVPTNRGSLLHVRSNASSQFQIPGMCWLLRRSIRADLRRLRNIVESDYCLSRVDEARPDCRSTRTSQAHLRQQLLEDQHDGLGQSRMYDT